MEEDEFNDIANNIERSLRIRYSPDIYLIKNRISPSVMDILICYKDNNPETNINLRIADTAFDPNGLDINVTHMNNYTGIEFSFADMMVPDIVAMYPYADITYKYNILWQLRNYKFALRSISNELLGYDVKDPQQLSNALFSKFRK